MPENTFHRSISLRANKPTIDPENRTLEVSFSSEKPYTRQGGFFSEPWTEILGHESKEVDLTRLNAGAPVLYNHDRFDADNRIGVVEKAWMDGKRGRAVIRISKREDVDGIWKDIEDGILVNVSVGYQIKSRTLIEEKDGEPPVYRVDNWEPFEISLVDVPADISVGVGRSKQSSLERVIDAGIALKQAMDEHQVGDADPALNVETDENQPNQEMERNMPDAIDKKEIESAEARGREAGVKAEQQRRSSVRSVFAGDFSEQYRDLLDSCLDDVSITEDQARKLLLEKIGSTVKPSGSDIRAEVITDERDKFRDQAAEAIACRAGFKADKDAPNNELRGHTMYEMARMALERAGVNTRGMDRMTLVGRAFTHSTSDFPIILANTANKSMLKGWEEQPETFDQWTSRGVLTDFKAVDRVGMNTAPDLLEVPAGSEFKYGTMGERKEVSQLLTYGRLFSITRQAIINDDLGAFTRIPQSMGRAARRKVGDLAYAVLTANAAMNDGTALFHANHSNLAGSGAAISITTLDAAKKAMATQKASSSSEETALNIRGSYLLVPYAVETTAKTLMASETDPSQSNSKKPNIFRNAFTVIADARLDADSATAWYVAADPSVYDTVEIAYLDGNDTPFLDQKDGWDIDGVEFKVRIDAAATALDYRTLYKNAGA